MNWLDSAYKNPTQAQQLAYQARSILTSLNLPCTCEHGDCPPEHYFPWPDDNGPIPKGTLLPSYVPVTKTCKPCELSSILAHIIDPDDVAGVFT